MEIIRELLWLWILGALGGTGYLIYALYYRDAALSPASGGERVQPQITTRRIPVGPPPVARPANQLTPTPIAPTRSPTAPAPVGEHQRRGSAPTVKLPISDASRPGSDDADAADLFSGLSAAKAKADAAPPIIVPVPPQMTMPKGIVEQAERIEERGFHVGALKKDIVPERQTTDGQGTSVAVPGQGRSQTSELDDILKRIDAVLSESNAPQSEATMTGGQQGARGGDQTMPLAQPSPVVEKSDRKATDPNQQKLF